MIEEWKIDEQGFVDHPKNFFHVRDILGVSVTNDSKLLINFRNNSGLAYEFKDPADAGKLLMWFCEIMRAAEKERTKHVEEHHAFNKELLDNQKKILQCDHAKEEGKPQPLVLRELEPQS